MTREKLLEIVNAIPEEFLGAYSIQIGSNPKIIQLGYDKNIAAIFGKEIKIDERGYATFKTPIAGIMFEIVMT